MHCSVCFDKSLSGDIIEANFVTSFHRIFVQSSNITVLDPVGRFSASVISHVWHSDCFAKQ